MTRVTLTSFGPDYTSNSWVLEVSWNSRRSAGVYMSSRPMKVGVTEDVGDVECEMMYEAMVKIGSDPKNNSLG